VSEARHQLGERTIGNALWNIVPFVWSFALGLVVVPVVVNGIGLERFGLYGAFAVLFSPLNLANLGFGEATIKYVAHYRHAGDMETAAQFVRTTLWMNCWVGLIGGALLWWWGPALTFRFFHVPAADRLLVQNCFVLVGLGWFLNQIAAVFIGIPAALQNFRVVAMAQGLVATITAVLSIGIVVQGGGLLGYILANTLGSLAAVVIWYIYSQRLFGRVNLTPRLYPAIWKRSFHFGGWQALAQVGALLATQSERFLLGYFLNPAALGLYNVALSLEQKAYFVAFKMSEVLFPLFSALSADTQLQKANQLLRASWLLTTLGVMVLAPLLPLAQPLLAVWINPEVGQRAGVVLQTLAIAGMIGCAVNGSYFFLLGNGRTAWIAALSLLTGTVTITVSLWVLPIYGLKAAAVSTLAAMMAQQAVVGFCLLKKVLGRSVSSRSIFLSLYLPIVVGLTIGLGIQLLLRADWISNWGWLILSYLAIAGMCGLGILLANHFSPNSRQHSEDVRRIVEWVRSQLHPKPNLCS